jgi:hypothetical protein
LLPVQVRLVGAVGGAGTTEVLTVTVAVAVAVQ